LLAAKNAGEPIQTAAVRLLKASFRNADLGLKVRGLEAPAVVALESDSAVLSDLQVEKAREAAAQLKLNNAQVLTYLANTLRVGARETPYSLVTALDDAGLQVLLGQGRALPAAQQVVLNDWAARDLGARLGDKLTLEYYVWREEGRLDTQSAEFNVSAIVPLQGAAADRNYAPDYPGITDAHSLADWDPPFPIDLKRVRKLDEEYWDKYRTTPKAFLRLQDGQRLWATRYGKVTSLRLFAPGEPRLPEIVARFDSVLREKLDPLQTGLLVLPVKSQSLQAAQGATDFGEYFSYFSFFLVISALLLASLFFKLGIEQRLREIGLLRAVGYSLKQIRALFLREGVVLAAAGSLLGIIGALLFAWLMMLGLRTWWVGAVGTTLLKLHLTPRSLAIGASAGVVIALAVIAWTLRSLTKIAPRSLLLGSGASDQMLGVSRTPRRRFFVSPRLLAVVFAAFGLLLLGASVVKLIGQAGGFFGAGTCLLLAALFGWSAWLRGEHKQTLQGQGWSAVVRLGFRNASVRAGRSVLCIALIAAASFIIVAVDAFRRDSHADITDKASGTGGYPLLAESLLPIVRDLNSEQGREELNLNDEALRDVRFTRFRLRPGDDASCLNLYAPRNPRILGAPDEFIQAGRFSFQSALAQSDEEKRNPWLLLNSAIGAATGTQPVIPVIADANSMTYVLHKALGDELEINNDNGTPVKLKLVAALSDSLLQGELLMSERNFVRLFPSIPGQRFFLVDTAKPGEVGAKLEERLSDYGFDVQETGAKLAELHRVENTYLSTFQALGALGLLLGTVGLAAVLLRNVLERRRELALLRATGYQADHLAWLVLAENVLLLGCGLLTGVVCALVAIAPTFIARGGHLSIVSLGLLLLAVLVTGLAASLLAVRAVMRAPLLAALRSE
jgi:ABC-type antimicrobial peptide transport system permease subunit